MSQAWEVTFRQPQRQSGKPMPAERMKLIADDADKARRLARDAGWEVISIVPWSAKSNVRVAIRVLLTVLVLAIIAAAAMARGCKAGG